MPSPSFVRSDRVGALNALLNHPEIRRHLYGSDRLDGADLLAEGALFYLSEYGGALFHGQDGIVEGHYLFLPEGRGVVARNLALGMIDACVLQPGHRLLWGRVDVAHRAARLFTRQLGFVSLGIRDAPLPSEVFVWGRHARPRSYLRGFANRREGGGDGACSQNTVF